MHGMSDAQRIATQHEATRPETASEVTAPPKPGLREVLQDIRHDSRRDPVRYLGEVVVPFGGE